MFDPGAVASISFGMDSNSESFSTFAVQMIDRINIEVYGGFRKFGAETQSTSFRNISTVFAGARNRLFGRYLS